MNKTVLIWIFVILLLPFTILGYSEDLKFNVTFTNIGARSSPEGISIIMNKSANNVNLTSFGVNNSDCTNGSVVKIQDGGNVLIQADIPLANKVFTPDPSITLLAGESYLILCDGFGGNNFVGWSALNANLFPLESSYIYINASVVTAVNPLGDQVYQPQHVLTISNISLVVLSLNVTSPIITIQYPTNNDILDNKTHVFNITGTVTQTNGTIVNVTINDTNFRNDGNNTLFNFVPLNLTPGKTYSLSIRANNTLGNITYQNITLTFDNTAPLTISDFDNNFSIFYVYDNSTLQINFTDNNKLFSVNVSTPQGYALNYQNLNSSIFILNSTFNRSVNDIGTYNITAYWCDKHNESIGLTCRNRTWNYHLFNYSAIFSNSVVETGIDEIILTLNFVNLSLTSNGSIIYDGTSYNMTTTGNNIIQINLTRNQTIPDVINNQTNVTFYFMFNLNGTGFTTINYSQIVTRISLSVCGGLTNTYVLNISIFNEQSPTEYLKSDIDAIFNVWTNDTNNIVNFSFMFTGHTNYSICLYPNTSINVNAQLFYNTSGGFDEKWFLRSAKLTSNTSKLSIYNFKSQAGIDQLRGVTRDANFDFYPNAYTYLQRYYPSENIWRTVQMDQSDDFGNVLFNIIEGTQDYRLIFVKDSSVVDSTGNLKFLCDTNDICSITFLVDEPEVLGIPNLNVIGAYDNFTEVFEINFTDTTGLTNNVRMIVTRDTGSASAIICDKSVSSSSGTMNCNTTGYSGSIRATIYKTVDDLIPHQVFFIFKPANKIFKLVGKEEAALWSSGILSTIIIIGSMVHPVVGFVAMVIGLSILKMFSLLNFLTTPLITLIGVISIIIGILLERRRG